MNWAVIFSATYMAATCHYETAQGLCCRAACAVEKRIDASHADLALDICVKRYWCAGKTKSADDFCDCKWRTP